MRTYELIDAMTFRTGRFLLTDEQLRRRRYVVNVIDGNLVEPRSEISFKRGELVCTDVQVPKALEHKMRFLVPEEGAPIESDEGSQQSTNESEAPTLDQAASAPSDPPSDATADPQSGLPGPSAQPVSPSEIDFDEDDTATHAHPTAHNRNQQQRGRGRR